MPIPYLFRAVGFNSIRTAGNVPPPTITWPTPLTCESFCARMVDAASYMLALAHDVRGERKDHDRERRPD